MNIVVIIPAVKKNVAFPDDLVKKIAGVPLVQRAINNAKALVPEKDIVVVTDSEEISLISTRSNIRYYYDKTLRLENGELFRKLQFYLLKIAKDYKASLLLSPYCPLLSVVELTKAYQKFCQEKISFLQPVRKVTHSIFQRKNSVKLNLLADLNPASEFYVESQAFQIFDNKMVLQGLSWEMIEPVPYEIGAGVKEIDNFHDWWVCEKILNRKRIIFRVIGNNQVGMGHIFRSLSLAKEITDHEIRFVCDHDSELAATKIAGYDYWLMTYPRNEIEKRIVELEPDIVINDILDTEKEYILRLKENNIKVVNFEDLGSGACHTDLTINELYDDPVIEGNRILWGHKYFFVRDEFNEARPRRFTDKVESILISFGGTDPNNLTREIFLEFFRFAVNMISGYTLFVEKDIFTKEFEKEIKGIEADKVEFTCATGVISSIMERSQIAITSAGRTVYELAHMNIPSIVFPHHLREKTHLFANESRGFINLGLYDKEKSPAKVDAALSQLVLNNNYRKSMFEKMKSYEFSENKRNIIKLIFNLIEQDT